MGPLRSAELHELVCSGTWLFHRLFLSDPGHHQRRLFLRTLAPGLCRRLHRPIQYHDLDGTAMSRCNICVVAASRQLDRADCRVFGSFWFGERQQHQLGAGLRESDVHDRGVREVLRDLLHHCQFWVSSISFDSFVHPDRLTIAIEV